MKNIHALLAEVGITVPEDKKADFDKAVLENYRTVADYGKQQKKITDLETDLSDMTTRAETAETTLKGFDGVDLEGMQKQVADAKKAAEDAEKTYSTKLTQRDQRDWLKEQFDKYGVSSPYARKQLEAEIMADNSGLNWKDGTFFGFDDYMTAARKQDSGLYKTAEEKKAEQDAEDAKKKAPAFVGPTGDGKAPATKYVPPKLF